jgi:hypothetical protein
LRTLIWLYEGSIGGRRGAYRIVVGRLTERDHLEDKSINGRTILQLTFKSCYGDIDWIDVTEDRDRCRAAANAVMNLRFSYNAGNFLLDSLKGICSMQLVS